MSDEKPPALTKQQLDDMIKFIETVESIAKTAGISMTAAARVMFSIGEIAERLASKNDHTEVLKAMKSASERLQ